MNEKDNIVLTGFMGTGKTAVGRILAYLMNWSFVDADEEIVAHVGMSIPRIFETQGEKAFRQYEMQICQSLAKRERHVIATGGGMLVNAVNLETMQATGFIVCLDATEDELQRRLSDPKGRPLAANWRELFHKRQAAYAAITNHIDTTGKSVRQSAEEIIILWQKSLQ
jgi:shikimate kinase